jgi:hypothetical protein
LIMLLLACSLPEKTDIKKVEGFYGEGGLASKKNAI